LRRREDDETKASADSIEVSASTASAAIVERVLAVIKDDVVD
jgi:hypothetical protein